MAGGSLPRGGKAAYFRRLSELAPPEVRTRVTEFIESVAFREEIEAAVPSDSGSTSENYAAKNHDHDSLYALIDHTHAQYSLIGHGHDWPKDIGDLGDVEYSAWTENQVLMVNGLLRWEASNPAFNADMFSIFQDVDPTAIMNFDISTISTETTRTISVVDADMTILSTVNHDDLTDGGLTYLHTHDHDYLYNAGYYTHDEIDDHINDAGFYHDHGLLLGLGDDDHTQYLLRSEWAQNGFVDRSDVALSWDDGTMTLTIQPAVTDFSYFLAGVKYTETGSITEAIADTEGMWVFYIDAEGSMASVNNPSGSQVAQVITDYTIVAYVYWDAINNIGKLMYELHGASMSPETHRYAHFTQRAQYVSGMAIAGLVTDQNGDDDEDAQLGVETGAFDDEDLYQTLAAIATGDPIEIWYRSGASGDWRWTETTISGESFPVIPFSGGSGLLAWNEFTGGAWQQTEVGNADLVLCHIYATNIVDDGDSTKRKYIAIQGQNEYNTLGQARDGASVEINTLSYGTLPLEEIVPVATIIFQTSIGYANKVKARARTTDTGDDYIDWREATPRGGVPIGDHGALSGLADDDHAQYLLASAATDRATFATNWTDLTDTGDTTLHGHDVTGLTNWGGPYLPLTAGSGSPLSGDLEIEDEYSNSQHSLSGDGDVDLCQQGGGLKVSNGYVQLPYLASVPASPANGMIWMESDGLHLYYAGAEKVVAGV